MPTVSATKSAQSKLTIIAAVAETKEQQQQVGPKSQKWSLYVRNLNLSVTENAIYDFFGLRSSKHLQEACKFDLPFCKKETNLEDTEI